MQILDFNMQYSYLGLDLIFRYVSGNYIWIKKQIF